MVWVVASFVGGVGRLLVTCWRVCVDCLRSRPHEALRIAMRAHVEYRRRLGLPLEPRGMLMGLGAVFALMSA